MDILQNKLTKSQEITIAFVFGSIARQEEMAGSDIDLVVIGHLGLREITALLSGLTEKVGREINPHVFTVKEFKKRIARKGDFITQVLDEPKIFIFGDENELKTMAR